MIERHRVTRAARDAVAEGGPHRPQSQGSVVLPGCAGIPNLSEHKHGMELALLKGFGKEGSRYGALIQCFSVLLEVVSLPSSEHPSSCLKTEHILVLGNS